MPDLLDARERFRHAAAANPARWSVDRSASGPAQLHIYGAIGEYWGGVPAADVVSGVRALDVDELHVFINSPGGDVYDGMAIRNALRHHRAAVTVTVDGLAASAASVIATAGDTVIMAQGSELMIHDVWSLTMGNADQLRAEADAIDRISDNAAAMYAEKAGGDADEWRARMKAETWFTAEEAVAAGLADELDAAPSARAASAAPFDLSMYTHAGRVAAGEPARAAAAVADREEDTPMTDALTREQLDAALQESEQRQNRVLETRLATFAGATPEPGPTWPTFGAFAKALFDGDESAMQYAVRLAAYDGSTTADDKQPATWVADAIHLIKRTRKTLNKFQVLPLPAEGMSLEYLKLKSNSIKVEKQAGEGSNLTKGKIQLDSDSTPVETYGGWTELTKQQIERGSAAYISTSNTAMILEYARATEQVVRDALKAILAEKLADASLSIAVGAGVNEWLDLIVDAADLFDDLSYTLDLSLVSKDVFKRLMRLEDSAGNRLMLVTGAGINQVGELDLTNLTGRLASVRFEILPGADPNTVEFHDRIGFTTWESPGAPFRLQDQNIVNLTEAISQYGYMANASQFPDAIQAVEVTGAPAGGN